MVNLDKKVFGEITLKEVIGAEPTMVEFQDSLENQYHIMQRDLATKTQEELQALLDYQIQAEKETNSRPGSMALAQDKIQLLVNYSQKYISEIKDKLA